MSDGGTCWFSCAPAWARSWCGRIRAWCQENFSPLSLSNGAHNLHDDFRRHLRAEWPLRHDIRKRIRPSVAHEGNSGENVPMTATRPQRMRRRQPLAGSPGNASSEYISGCPSIFWRFPAALPIPAPGYAHV